MAETYLPLISVVVATYNGAAFIRKQLDSIINQNYPHIEIIVVDDASTDNTCAILHEYTAAFNFIRVFPSTRNMGYIKNFERGMLLANGSFIAPCDQDDIWKPEKLSVLFEHIEDSELVYADSELIDENDLQLNRRMSDIKNQIEYTSCLMYAVGAWAPGHAMLMKKELLMLCVPFPSIVTHDFWIGFIASGRSSVKYVNQSLVLYRQHPANTIGANTHRTRNKHALSRREKLINARKRMALLYEYCPAEQIVSKNVFKQLNECYQDFSLLHNWQRMMIFFKQRRFLLAYKKKSLLMQWLYCIKMFFKLV